jgi:Xaa-Pro dipeptidase
MTQGAGMRELAAQLRGKAFGALPENVVLIVSSNVEHKAYLSGYVSMAHDLSPQYRSAVLAGRAGAVLVTSAADAGPASDFLGDPDAVFRYGEFYFESDSEPLRSSFAKTPFRTFAEAFRSALASVWRGDGLIGVDLTDDELLWNLCCSSLDDSLVVDVTAGLRTARQTKLPGEVTRIRKATKLVENGFRQVLGNAGDGMTEIDLAAMVTRTIAAGGAVPRFVSVTSGPRSALADAYASDRLIRRGETIRIDAGCTFDGYWSDIGRTFVVGEPDARQSATYNALKSGLEAALTALRAGITARELFEIAMASVQRGGLPGYRRHHCGHGIGLKSYDPPLINASDETVLRPGMCVCIETPFYVLGLDGMMVEETILVTERDYEPISTLSRDLLVIA